jgi:imidazolonepropionase-like amidohydrolase
MRRPALLAFAASLLISSAPAETIVLRAGTVLDGKGGVLKNHEIVIEDGKIRAVRPAQKSNTPAYDLSALTVTPGWIDTHVHLDWHFDANHKLANRGQEKPQTTVAYAAENAWLTLQAGFTTVQSVGSPIDLEIRDRVDHGALPGPRILTSVRQINERSGDPDKLRELVRQTKREFADVIKLFATSGMGAGGAQTMTDAQLDAVCGEAKAQGLRAVVHAIGAGGIKAAIRAGCTSIEHGDFADEEALDLMRQKGVYFDPNFLVIHNYLDQKDSFPTFTPASFKALEDALDPTAKVLRLARKKGVKIVYGTDAVAGAHGRNAVEFLYRVKDGGEKPMDALISATSLAAESLSLDDRLGTIAPGYEADLVATRGNMLDDISAVTRVAFVMKGGRVYKNVAAGKP